MNFTDQWLLILLSLVPLLLLVYFFAWRKWKQKKAMIGDARLVDLLTSNRSPAKSVLKVFSLLTAAALLVLALANLQKPSEKSEVSRKGVDIMIALDVSRSMLAQDIQPDRLTRAKQFLQKLVDRLPDDRIGIVLFAGRAYLQMPLSTDHSAASMYIQQASPESVPTQGTVISEALQQSFNAFMSKERKYRSVVIISDGEDHDPKALQLAQEMSARGIMINTVGIGSPNGSQIIDPLTGNPKTDVQGNIVVSKLNEAELRQLAATTNGVYTRLENTQASVDAIVKQLGTIEKTAVSDTEFRDYKSYFQYFLIPALLLLLLEFFLGERKRKVAMVVMLLWAGNLSAQQENRQILKGNEYYREGKYDRAIEEYRKVLERNPDNSLVTYNLANAFYRQQKFAEAEELYARNERLTKDAAMLNKIYYNKGLVHTRKKELEKSIAAYKQALIHDPNDADARHNLQKALRELNKQNQQDSKKDPKENKVKKESKPNQQKSKLNRKQVEQLLKALQQQEQEVQKKYQQSKSRASSQPEKDW